MITITVIIVITTTTITLKVMVIEKFNNNITNCKWFTMDTRSMIRLTKQIYIME